MRMLVMLRMAVLLLILLGLGCASPEEKVKEGVEKLGSKSEAERNEGALELAGMGEEAKTATGALVRVLYDPSWKVRNSATYALKRIGTKEAIKAIVKTVPEHVQALKDEDPDVRFYAATGLGFIGSHARDAIPALMHATKDPEIAVQNAATYALKKIEVTSAR